MSRRIASLLVLLPLASALAACAAAPPAAVPTSSLPAVSPTAAPVQTPAHSSAPATASPDTGNVGGSGAPDFSVEPAGAQAIRVTLAAPDAKAWRLSVSRPGGGASDRWDLTIETGDVTPIITTAETASGVAGEPVEQPRLELGAATGTVCSRGLPVCVLVSSLQLPADGNGTVVLKLLRTDATAPLSVTAATARWDRDPFVLGPWTGTDAFPWGA